MSEGRALERRCQVLNAARRRSLEARNLPRNIQDLTPPLAPGRWQATTESGKHAVAATGAFGARRANPTAAPAVQPDRR